MIDGGRYDRTLKSDIFQQLKEQSVCLSQSITYGSHTIAAMHAVFSGCYGTRTGTNSYWSTFDFKKNKFRVITEYLHELGFYTFSDIVNKLVIPQQGFDEFLIHDELKDDLTKRHKEFLEKMKKKNDTNQNFFLYLQYSNIHTGIMEEVLKPYDNFSEEYFLNKEKNEERYDRLFNDAEKYLKKMMEKIKELGLLDSSIILVMSDHGISIGEKIGERAYGAFCYDYTIHNFAFFLIPEIAPMIIDQQVRTIDYMPTILDIMEIELSNKFESLDGESLFPLIKGENMDEKIAYSETGNPLKITKPPKQPNTFSVRTSDWKLIYNEYNQTKELYDLKNDPDEEKDLSGKNIEIENILWKKLVEIRKNN